MSAADPTPPAPAAAPPKSTRPLGLLALLAFTLLGGLLVFGFASALGPAVTAQNEAPCRPLEPSPRSGAAPDFEAQDLQGNTVRLSDFKGKFVVLNFWATWCEPCIGEWPQFDRLADRLVDRDDVVVLAVSIDKSPAEIVPFLERMSLASTRVKVLWDPTQKAHNAYGSEKIPDTYFVDRRGDVAAAYVNVREWGRPGAHRCVVSMADS